MRSLWLTSFLVSHKLLSLLDLLAVGIKTAALATEIVFICQKT